MSLSMISGLLKVQRLGTAAFPCHLEMPARKAACSFKITEPLPSHMLWLADIILHPIKCCNFPRISLHCACTKLGLCETVYLHWADITEISGEPRRCSHEWITVEAVQSWIAASEKNVMQLE